jgi:osmotically inducible protein OsmC
VPKAERRAEVVWHGDLLHGSGTIVAVGSGALDQLPVTWAARTESSDGKTSPEELIAAAHAACFSMALSHGLAQSGTTADELTVRAVCSFEQVGDGWQITTIELDVDGRVPGIDAEAFEQAAEEAKAGCPVSQALEGNVEITVRPRLHEE